jgi:hypothetical protein
MKRAYLPREKPRPRLGKVTVWAFLEELFEVPLTTYVVLFFCSRKKTVANQAIGCCKNITQEREKQACHHEWVCPGSDFQVLVERR